MVNVHGGSDWWQSHLGQDLSSDFPTKPQPQSIPEQAKQAQKHPRKEFEENVLKNVSRRRSLYLPLQRPKAVPWKQMSSQKYRA